MFLYFFFLSKLSPHDFFLFSFYFYYFRGKYIFFTGKKLFTTFHVFERHEKECNLILSMLKYCSICLAETSESPKELNKTNKRLIVL